MRNYFTIIFIFLLSLSVSESASAKKLEKKSCHIEKKRGHLIKKIDLQITKDQFVLGPVNLTMIENSNSEILTFQVVTKNKADIEKISFAVRPKNHGSSLLSGEATPYEESGKYRFDIDISTLVNAEYNLLLTIILKKKHHKIPVIAFVRFLKDVMVYYDGDLEPPAPGTAGDATLLGVDTDNDGVRDDVERWINKKNLLSNQRSVLITFAKHLQSRTQVSQDRATSNTLTRKILNYDYCMKLQFSPAQLKKLTADVQIEQYNTRERLIEWARTQGNFGGQELIAESDESKWPLYCEE